MSQYALIVQPYLCYSMGIGLVLLSVVPTLIVAGEKQYVRKEGKAFKEKVRFASNLLLCCVRRKGEHFCSVYQNLQGFPPYVIGHVACEPRFLLFLVDLALLFSTTQNHMFYADFFCL